MAAAALGYIVITALLFHNLLPVITTNVYADLGDPLLNTAILQWNATYLPLTDAWWNFPAFAPLSGVTAFTEHLVGAFPIASPIIWNTGNAVLAYNALLLLCFPLNGIATFMLVRELTGSAAGAFIGGLAFAFAPYVAEHVAHVQLLMASGMPIALYGLHRFATHGRPSDLAWFAFGWLNVVLSNAYSMVFFPIVAAMWAAWFMRGAGWRTWIALAVTAILATLPVIPLLLGYHLRQNAYGMVRGLAEIKAMSATLASIAGVSHRALLWKRWLPSTYYESSLFPGFAIAALALVGAVKKRGDARFYFVAAVVMWLLALGPERGPYWLLLQVPGAQSIRVPARAWLPAALCLAVCAGFGAAWLAEQRRARWLVAALAVLIVAEGSFFEITMRAPVSMLTIVPVDAMVLDLPLSAGYGNADAQYLAVLGGYRVVNGYSGYYPPYLDVLRHALADHRPEAFAPFRQISDLYVVVRPDVDQPFINWLESQRGIESVREGGQWRLYHLPRQGTAPPPPIPLPLPRAGEPALSIP